LTLLFDEHPDDRAVRRTRSVDRFPGLAAASPAFFAHVRESGALASPSESFDLWGRFCTSGSPQANPKWKKVVV